MSNNPRILLKEAKRLIDSKRFDKAKTILQPLIIENNNDYKVFALLAYVYHKEGQFLRAIKNYQKAIELNSKDTESMINLSLVYNDLGRYQEGAELYQRATEIFLQAEKNRDIEIDDTELDVLFSKQHAKLGEMYLRYNKADQALLEYEKALALNPNDYSFLVEMADCLSRQGKRKLAVKQLKILKNKKPKLLEARIKLGHLLFLEGDLASAINEWDQILHEDPNNIEAKLYLKMVNQESI